MLVQTLRKDNHLIIEHPDGDIKIYLGRNEEPFQVKIAIDAAKEINIYRSNVKKSLNEKYNR